MGPIPHSQGFERVRSQGTRKRWSSGLENEVGRSTWCCCGNRNEEQQLQACQMDGAKYHGQGRCHEARIRFSRQPKDQRQARYSRCCRLEAPRFRSANELESLQRLGYRPHDRRHVSSARGGQVRSCQTPTSRSCVCTRSQLVASRMMVRARSSKRSRRLRIRFVLVERVDDDTNGKANSSFLE